MLILQEAKSDASRRHGSRRVDLSQLREQLACPSALVGADHRQRLLELEQRLLRLQALGGEYARVEFSDSASSVLRGGTVSV